MTRAQLIARLRKELADLEDRRALTKATLDALDARDLERAPCAQAKELAASALRRIGRSGSPRHASGDRDSSAAEIRALPGQDHAQR
jgi:hypothetical protein